MRNAESLATASRPIANSNGLYRGLDVRLSVAIAAVWLLWGSTYAGMRLAVATMPPFAMASVRFSIAGLILYLICVARGRAAVTRDDIARAVVTGSTLLVLGNGITAWTVQYLPTGVNSLLLSLVPIWMAIIAFVWGRERPTRAAIVGKCFGFAGLALLLLQPHGSGSVTLGPALLAVCASIAWAFGSIYQRRAPKVHSLICATALQMLAGGLLLGVQAALFGQWRQINLHAISAASLGGFVWLIFFGSLLGYSAYLYTMQAARPALAATYAYVNPIVAVIIGILIFHERFTATEAIAGAIILFGVALMMLPPLREPTRSIRAADSSPFKPV